MLKISVNREIITKWQCKKKHLAPSLCDYKARWIFLKLCTKFYHEVEDIESQGQNVNILSDVTVVIGKTLHTYTGQKDTAILIIPKESTRDLLGTGRNIRDSRGTFIT